MTDYTSSLRGKLDIIILRSHTRIHHGMIARMMIDYRHPHALGAGLALRAAGPFPTVVESWLPTRAMPVSGRFFALFHR